MSTTAEKALLPGGGGLLEDGLDPVLLGGDGGPLGLALEERRTRDQTRALTTCIWFFIIHRHTPRQGKQSSRKMVTLLYFLAILL